MVLRITLDAWLEEENKDQRTNNKSNQTTLEPGIYSPRSTPPSNRNICTTKTPLLVLDSNGTGTKGSSSRMGFALGFLGCKCYSFLCDKIRWIFGIKEMGKTVFVIWLSWVSTEFYGIKLIHSKFISNHEFELVLC